MGQNPTKNTIFAWYFVFFGTKQKTKLVDFYYQTVKTLFNKIFIYSSDFLLLKKDF